jgi:membrane protein required for colicin V production
MNIIDIILAIPLLWALYRGFRKGLVYMVASLVALVLGILGAMKFHAATGNVIDNWFEIKPEHVNILGFAITFLLIVVLVHLAAFFVDKVIKAVALNFINRLAGMVVGVLISAFVVSVVLQPIDAANRNNPFLSQETIEGSLLYRPMTRFAPMVFPYLKRDQFRKWLPLPDRKGEETMEVDDATKT